MRQFLKQVRRRPRSIVVLALTALLPATLVAIGPVVYPTPALVSVAISLAPGDQYYPHVSGDWVAYTSELRIHYYNFSTNVDAEIPIGTGLRDFLSGISGSRIVFSRVTSVSGSTATAAVMLFDAATPWVAPIEIDPVPGALRYYTAVGGNTIAYIDVGLENSGELVIHDLASNTSQRITNDTFVDGNPSVSPDGNVVVWEHCPTTYYDCDIWKAVKTGGVWNASVVADNPGWQTWPTTNGTLVAYASTLDGSTQDIVWRPMAGGPEVHLELPVYSLNPRIAGDFIVFESRTSVVLPGDLFVYDVVNNRLFQLTDTPQVEEQLADITVLPDGSLRVVWTSDEDGQDQRNIRGATFRLPNIAPTLSASTEPGYGNDGVNPDLGPPPTTFTYKVVYADFEHQAPASINVCIDGVCQPMTVDAASAGPLQDGDTQNGEQYSYSTTLALGSHGYYFEASDGTATVRLPAAGVFSGPIVSDLAISTTMLPGGTVGSAYGATVLATGGTPPYHWDSGSLPPGLVMDYSTGVISGTPTAPGTYMFTVFVSDASGAFASKTVTIVVSPIPTPPVLQVPGNIITSATSRAGAAVTFVVTATDVVDPHPMVVCLPASGFVFPIGTTTVSCTATNAAGLSSRATFTVLVKGAAAQVVDLIGQIAHMKLRPGVDNTLEVRLASILAALVAGGRTANVCGQLDGFLNEVHVQTGRALTAAQAAQLTAGATQIKAVLGCP